MNYIIAVDETGEFHPGDPKSFVGGYITRNFSPGTLRNSIRDFTSQFNNEIRNRPGWEESDIISCPGHLHYSQLTTEPAKRRETDITIRQEWGEEFTERFITHFREIMLLLFRSDGSTATHIHEQHSYFTHLMTALLGSVHESSIQRGDSIELLISSRRHIELMGPWGDRNKQKYEMNLSGYIRDKLCDEMNLVADKVHVRIEVNQRNEVLTMADFFISAMRHNRIESDHVRTYSVSDQDLYATDFNRQYIESIIHTDRLHGFSEALRIASEYPEQHPHRKSFTRRMSEILPSLTVGEIESLVALIDTWTSSIIAERRTNPGMVSLLMNAVEILEQLDIEASLQEPSREKLYLEVLWMKVQLLSHGAYREKLDHEGADGIFREYREYSKNNGARVYSDPLTGIKRRIDGALILAQGEYFNFFNFSAIEDFLKSDMDAYTSILKGLHGMDPNESDSLHKDDLLARMKGTIGQAYAFMASGEDLNHEDRKLFTDYARENLAEDIRLLEPGTVFWQQGVNFLVTLYWMTGDLDKARNEFFNQVAIKDSDPGLLWDFKERSPAYSVDRGWDLYILSNQLRLISAHLNRGEMKAEKSQLKDIMAFVDEKGPDYPANIAAKWIAYILYKSGFNDDAISILKKTTRERRTNPVLDIMRCVELSLLAHLLANNNDKEMMNAHLVSAQGICKEAFTNQHIKAFLEGKKLFQTLHSGNITEVDPWVIVTSLPYYYS